MGDLLNNSEIFKKLGFDSSNQWIFYDDRFQNFFSFLSENITDANVLTEHELLEREELKLRNEWLSENRTLKLKELESKNPGLLKHTEGEVAALTQEIEQIEAETKEYNTLIDDMRHTKHSINNNLNELEHSITALHNAEKELILECRSKAQQLEELQSENTKLCADAERCFTKPQTPPLFMHQLPLDQYFLKCDSFMQHFTLYMKVNFKIQEFDKFTDVNEDDLQDVNNQLHNLEKSIEHYTLAYIKEKAKAEATQALIDNLLIGQIHCISIADITRETNELKLLNEHHLNNAYETLMGDLPVYVQQHTQQRMELVLYENTKQKLERAQRRQENDKRLTKIISDALSNAELVWIAIQLDLEKKVNRFDNTKELNTKAELGWQRVQLMRSINSTYQGNSAQFVQEIATKLGAYQSNNVKNDAKSCLYEYEKFGRLLSYALQSMLHKKSYAMSIEQLNELKRLEKSIQPYVYDSPLEKPMFEHVRYLRPIYHATMQHQRIDKMLRNLRMQFQEQVTERMDMDKLFRYSQLLWTWFLTEPQRVLHAIDEVKKASAKVPSLTGIKTLGGIKRK